MRFFIEAYGCTMNQGEARIMAELMEQRGWSWTDSVDDADILVLATCTVIETTERRMVKRIKCLNSHQKPLIVAGCMGQVQYELIKSLAPESHIIGPLDFRNDLKRILAEYPVGKSTETDVHIPDTHPTRVDGIVPIAQGCASHCSYCIVKLVRGDLKSYQTRSILDRVKKELGKGAKEIRLTALDTATYGLDSGTDLPALIKKVCSLDGDFRVRVGMANPVHMLPILEELVDAYRYKKVYKFLHLPVQSGNDGVLKRMNRGYVVEDFLRIVDTFKNEFPDLTLSTDIIVGFPGETEAEYEDSFRLVKRIRPDIVNITRFSPRPGTAAKTMKDQIVGRIVKERSRKLNRLRAEISSSNNEWFLDRIERVLTVEYGKNGTTVGRTGSYRPVVIFNKLPLGEFFNARIVDNGETYLIGKCIR